MTKCIPYIVIAVLLVSLVISLTNRKEVVIEKNTSDTVYVTKIDTTKSRNPKPERDTIVDTFYIVLPSGESLELPKTQKYYKDSLYEAWVSGYKPNLDSINIYKQTKFVTITNTTTKEIYPKTTALYFNFGTMYISDKFAPKLGAGIKLKNDMIINTNLGLYDKSIFYELSFNIKIK